MDGGMQAESGDVEREGFFFSFFCLTEVAAVTSFPPKEMWHKN